MVLGLPGVIRASYQCATALATSATEAGIGIARNGTTPLIASAVVAGTGSGDRSSQTVSCTELAPPGRHYIQAVENGADGVTFHGASGKALAGLNVELSV
jgi:hypothetical protein